MKGIDFVSINDKNVKLVAVSKTHSTEAIQKFYCKGMRIFGENKPQELVAKYNILPKDIEWHFIGHLQTNKIKLIIPFISLIHSIDSPRLLESLNKEAAKVNRVVPCLLQVHIAKEQTKYGFMPDELLSYLQTKQYSTYPYVKISGLMGMATNTKNVEQVRNEFRLLKNLFNILKSDLMKDDSCFTELSMGMSHDYEIAIDEGATIIRIGSLLFGERNYPEN